MSDLYLYNPDICDGDFCPQDCKRCYKREKAEEAAYEEIEEWHGPGLLEPGSKETRYRPLKRPERNKA